MSESTPRFSVIIPAYNEGAVIDACLNALLDGAAPGEMEVLVCPNGCSDDTAERAAAFGDPVRVIHVPVASKPAALNAGDRAARGPVKVFLDADIALSGTDVTRVVERLERGPELVAAPRIRVDLTGCSAAVRGHYRIWMRTPYVTHGMVGSGVYALSAEGRARFDEFPKIIGDDAYVRCLFAPHERASVAGTEFVVRPPRTLAALVHIETRRKAAAHEMREMLAERPGDAGPSQTGALLAMCINPMNWFGLAVYAYVKTASRIRFAGRLKRGTDKSWSRDDTSRS